MRRGGGGGGGGGGGRSFICRGHGRLCGGQHVPGICGNMDSYTPNHWRWCAKWRLGWNTHTSHARFCTFWRRFAMLRRCLLTKFSGSELSRKSSIVRVPCCSVGWLGDGRGLLQTESALVNLAAGLLRHQSGVLTTHS